MSERRLDVRSGIAVFAGKIAVGSVSSVKDCGFEEGYVKPFVSMQISQDAIGIRSINECAKL
jgi:hypothetical protein